MNRLRPTIKCSLILITAGLIIAGCSARQTPYGKLDGRAALILDRYYAGSYKTDPSVDDLRRQIESARRLQGWRPRIHKTSDITTTLDGRNLDARIYYPSPDPELPITVYYHGGGWVRGGIETHDIICAKICRQAECIVVAVDYRRAPEHPFPAAVDDAYDTLAWIARNAEDFGGDPHRRP